MQITNLKIFSLFLILFSLEVPVNGAKPPDYMSDEDSQDYRTKSKSKKERFLTQMEGGEAFVLEYEDGGEEKTKKKKKKKRL